MTQDVTCVHSYKVPTSAELWELATKAVEKHGFKSVREAIDYAIRAKEAEKIRTGQ